MQIIVNYCTIHQKKSLTLQLSRMESPNTVRDTMKPNLPKSDWNSAQSMMIGTEKHPKRTLTLQ